MRRQILTAKSGISNHVAAGIFDDPCLSKFGALRGSCPHPGRQFVGLLCVSLAAPESPPIVSGVSDMHPSDCPNVEETRNLMPATAWKKYTNFAPKNLPPSVYSGTFLFSGIPVILLIPPKRSMLIVTIPCGRQTTFPSALPPL